MRWELSLLQYVVWPLDVAKACVTFPIQFSRWTENLFGPLMLILFMLSFVKHVIRTDIDNSNITLFGALNCLHGNKISNVLNNYKYILWLMIHSLGATFEIHQSCPVKTRQKPYSLYPVTSYRKCFETLCWKWTPDVVHRPRWPHVVVVPEAVGSV